jgi:Barstar (barnase inhibitor)
MRVSIEQLREASAPWLLSFEGSAAKAYELAWRLATDGGAVRVLRGHKMRTAAALFDEAGAALQFPDYFGENWPALDECLMDLSWMPGEWYVIVIVRAGEMLAEESKEMLGLLWEVFSRAGTTWAEPVAQGQSWDRPAIPFHVILQVQPGERKTLLDEWGDVITEFTE